MPSQSYALEKGGPRRLELRWGLLWKDFEVRLDGAQVGTAQGPEELEQGKRFALPDGSELSVQLSRTPFGGGLHLARNGEPLPGSSAEGTGKVRIAAYTFLVIAALVFVTGVVGARQLPPEFRGIFLGTQLAMAATFALCGIFTWRRSLLALGVGILLFAALTLMQVFRGMAAGGPLFLNVVLLVLMIRGFVALRQSRTGQ
jgi:hypothetical protein